MGGFGSGRTGGKPTVDVSYQIDLPWLARQGWVVEGRRCHGSISWSSKGRPRGSIRYVTIMDEPGQERLELFYVHGPDDARETVEQVIRLVSTRPNYGGKRWWMICPFTGARVAKLYKPRGAHRFAGRRVWNLAYQSQRDTPANRHFGRLFALQEKLGGDVGYDAFMQKPKGMWRRTFARHSERHLNLQHICDLEMDAVIGRLKSL